MKMISTGLKAALDLMLPRTCNVCGRRLLLRERFVCLHCLADLPLTRFEQLEHNPMADRFNHLLQQKLDEGSYKGHERYVRAAALFFFREDNDYRHIIYRLKYAGDIGCGRHFAGMLGRRLKASRLFDDVDLVIPVPLHWTRKWKRGYNQAEIIASELAGILGAGLEKDILIRRKRTRTQTKLLMEDKARNVNEAFAISPSAKKAGQPHIPRPETVRHILLADDVFTSGSTLMACFTTLRSVFPPSVRISVATLAFVGEA